MGGRGYSLKSSVLHVINQKSSLGLSRVLLICKHALSVCGNKTSNIRRLSAAKAYYVFRNERVFVHHVSESSPLA